MGHHLRTSSKNFGPCAGTQGPTALLFTLVLQSQASVFRAHHPRGPNHHHFQLEEEGHMCSLFHRSEVPPFESRSLPVVADGAALHDARPGRVEGDTLGVLAHDVVLEEHA